MGAVIPTEGTTPRGPYTGPGVPYGCRRDRLEVARLEWRIADGGDPAELIAQFCAAVGLPVGDMASGAGHIATDEGLCGVALLISAAAGAVMIGGRPGENSPVEAVPDVVAIAYVHGHGGDASGRVAKPAGLELGPWRPSWQSDDHAAAVTAAVDAIVDGEVYQVNIVGHQRAEYAGDVAAAFTAVANLPGAEYGGVMTGSDWAVASASPECLLEVGHGRVTTKPIKGTRPATELGDKELRTSVKEHAEHVMIVDLQRNDLAHVARPGTIEVPELFAIRQWCGLWQAESTVTARLADEVGLAALLRAVCPPGSVTGTPKLAALEHIGALEPVGRGPAMGAMGYLTTAGLSLGLTIRTVAADAGGVHLWAGGGITWRSDPMAEVAEAAGKAAPVKALLAGLASRNGPSNYDIYRHRCMGHGTAHRRSAPIATRPPRNHR